MPQRRYHYTTRMASWTHSPEDFQKLRTWASKQKDFWTNLMGGNLACFAFWAYPKDVVEIFEQQGWYLSALSIDVGRDAVPEEER